MPKNKHKYRVSVYLGKKIYTELEQTAKVCGCSVATLTKILLETGFDLVQSIDKNKEREVK